jgi:hypothetical protein
MSSPFQQGHIMMISLHRIAAEPQKKLSRQTVCRLRTIPETA